MDSGLGGKVATVSGASKGIGRRAEDIQGWVRATAEQLGGIETGMEDRA